MRVTVHGDENENRAAADTRVWTRAPSRSGGGAPSHYSSATGVANVRSSALRKDRAGHWAQQCVARLARIGAGTPGMVGSEQNPLAGPNTSTQWPETKSA